MKASFGDHFFFFKQKPAYELFWCLEFRRLLFGSIALGKIRRAQQPRLLRPANLPEGNPGSGVFAGAAKNGVKYAVLNLQGRVFLRAIDDPFRKADSELGKLPADVSFVLVDMHAETTSEKIAMGYY